MTREEVLAAVGEPLSEWEGNWFYADQDEHWWLISSKRIDVYVFFLDDRAYSIGLSLSSMGLMFGGDVILYGCFDSNDCPTKGSLEGLRYLPQGLDVSSAEVVPTKVTSN